MRHGLYAAAPAGSQQAGRVRARESVKNVAARPDRPAETTAKANGTATAKQSNGYRKTTAKPEVEATTKSTANVFAVDLFADEDEDFAVADFFAVDGVNSKEWRIEKRTYEKQDGTLMLYYNYRRRKGKKDKKTGRRINEYRPGGKRVMS